MIWKGKKQKNKRKLFQILIFFLLEEMLSNSEDHGSMIVEAKRKATECKGLKILTPEQILQRLPTALVQVKAGNNSQSLLNEIRQIVYYLYQSKKLLKRYAIT